MGRRLCSNHRKRHIEYWIKYSIPVYVIIADPERKLFLWQKVERRLCTPTRGGWRIGIPRSNPLNPTAKPFFERPAPRDAQSIARAHFKLDRELIDEISRTGRAAIFVWDEWRNENAWRNLRIYIDGDRSVAADLVLDLDLAADGGLPEIMEKVFPWSRHCYAEETSISAEVKVHVLSVELRNEATAYLQLERFLKPVSRLRLYSFAGEGSS